jgi:phage terminase large subunit
MSEVLFPEKLHPLFKPARYKVLWGGRGGAKSWGVARALLTIGSMRPIRILCAREIQKTISDSVHKLLTDQIVNMGLHGFYRITEASITGINGTEFLFTGLRQLDAAKIKSYEGVDIAWCEEAQAISKKSWDVLTPTIRKEDSEIWVTFNPELDSDETYQRYIVNPPPDAWVQKMNWTDNPWFPDVLEKERQHLQKINPEEHDHIWGGNCKTVVDGAIYAREVIQMIEDKRVRPVPYDPALKVHTVWDLGWNDQTSIILVQRLHSEVRVIDYIEDNQRTLADYVAELNYRTYVWGKDWLPHDGGHKDLKTGKSAKEILRKLGRKSVLIPKLPIETGISAVRMMLPRLYIDEVKGKRLIECLKRYRRNIPTTTGEPGVPVHDEYSHAADAVRGLGVIVDKIDNEDERTSLPGIVRRHVIHDPAVGY